MPLPAVLVEELRRVREAQAEYRHLFGDSYEDHDLVFCQPNGRPLHGHNISTRDLKRVLNLEALRKELRAKGVPEDAVPKGLPAIRFHDLRQGVGTHLGKLGVPVKVIQEYLGHSTPTITLSFYSHVLPGMKEEAAVHLAARLLGTHGSAGPEPRN